jgi:pantoate--beta-alanine ligase
MSGDLCLGVEVRGGETVREPDGLALSSRNRYLDTEQRRTATALSRTLLAAQATAADGLEATVEAGRAELRHSPGVDLDYFVVTDPALGELPPDPPPGTQARALIAAKIGSTRLIDNLPLVIGPVDNNEVVPDVLRPPAEI